MTIPRLAVKRTRPRGYITNYRPRLKTLELLQQVKEVLREYHNYLPLSVRQVFYILVGRFGHPKDELFYGRLCEHVGNARRARVLPFEAIRDDDVASCATPALS